MFTFTKMFTKQTIGLFAIVFVLAFAASAPVAFEKTTSIIDDAIAAAYGPGDGGDGTGDGGDGCGGCGEADPGTETGGPGDGGDGTGDTGGDCCGGDGDDPGDPPGAFILDCMDPAATNYNPGADGPDNSLCTYAAPTCDSFTATPSTIDAGDASLLKWRTSNADKVELTRPFETQTVAEDGQVNVTPGKDYKFILTVTGHSGQKVTCDVTVKVNQPTPDQTCDSFTASPKTIDKGDVSLLKWTTTNATKVELVTSSGPQTVSADGQKKVTPGRDYAYVLKVYGDAPVVTCNVTVKVTQPTPAQTCDSLTASPTTIAKGDVSLLKWRTTNATKVELITSNGAQTVSANGQKNVTPGRDYTYVLKVYGVDPVVTCKVPVKVTQPTPAPTCDAFTATPSTIDAGEKTLLKWQTSNATKVELITSHGAIPVNVDGQKNVTPGKDYTYTLKIYGTNNQQVTCKVPVKVIPVPDAPSCDSFTATPSEINAGERSLLKWTTTNATKVELTRPGKTEVVAADGQTYVRPGKDYTFALTVYGANNKQVTCEVPVAVTGEGPLTCAANLKTFTASPDNLPVGGGNTTLTWEAIGVDTISINRGVLAETSKLKGSDVVSVADDTTYTLTLKRGTDSPVTCPVSVVVEDKNPKAVTCAANAGFTANPTKLPNGGGDVKLSWDTTRVQTVKLDGVAVSKTGSTTKTVTKDTTFVLEITGNKNTTGNTEECKIPVTVDGPTPSGISCAANVKTWKADDTSISRGSSVGLTWEATGLDTIEIDNGVLSETSDLTGSKSVSPSSDIRYVLTGKKGAKTITCELNIDVSSGGGGGGSSSPRCDFDASKTSIKAGEEITLSWDNRYARDLTVFDGDEDDGTKIFETDDDDLVDEGSLKVRPTKDTTYTLLVERGSRDRTCDVDIKVKDNVVLSSIRNQGMVAGISLTSVPYTGFEAGPMLTFIFYALLALWGLFVAYVLVVRGDRVAGVSLAGAHPKNPVVGSDYSTGAVSGDQKTSQAAAYVGSVLATPRTPAEAPASLPTNLPIGEAPVVGYQAAVEAVAAPTPTPATNNEIDAEMKELEDRAHDQHILLSSDAMRELVALCPRTIARLVYLDMIIAEAKVTYPAEDGWVILNQERVENICHKRNNALAKEATPIKQVAEEVSAPVDTNGAGSLAEAIVTGNIAAAYQMIGHRPMIALADAAADLDALYRSRKGEVVTISEMLQNESAQLTDAQIADAITALTSAIDGMYGNEAEAVKMSIMKAVKAVN